MYRLSFDEQLEDLTDISGTVADYIGRELYKADFGDEMENTYNHNLILANCYSIIIDELAEFGITFYEDESDLLTDWYTAKHIYYIRALVDSDNLLRVLSTRGDLDTLSSILDEENLSDLYQSVMDFIFPRTTAEIYEIIADFYGRVAVNERFRAHLRGCIARIRETGSDLNIPGNELPLVHKYINKVRKDRLNLKRLIQKLQENYPTRYRAFFCLEESRHLLRTYDLDKLSPCNIRKFATMDSDDYLDQDARKSLVDQHHESTQFHAEYFVKHQIPPTEPQVAFVILAIAADLPSEITFVERTTIALHDLKPFINNSTTVDSAKELIKDLRRIMYHLDEQG